MKHAIIYAMALGSLLVLGTPVRATGGNGTVSVVIEGDSDINNRCLSINSNLNRTHGQSEFTVETVKIDIEGNQETLTEGEDYTLHGDGTNDLIIEFHQGSVPGSGANVLVDGTTDENHNCRNGTGGDVDSSWGQGC